MFREMGSDIPSSKDSDDSGDCEDDEEEDLSDSLSGKYSYNVPHYCEFVCRSCIVCNLSFNIY